MEKVWSDWIEWAGGECPIPDAKAGEFFLKLRDGSVFTTSLLEANVVGWEETGGAFDIVAYRELIAPTACLEPTPEEVEATQLPETPAADEAADLRAMNAAMLARDLVEPKPVLKPMCAVVQIDHGPWHLRVSAWTNRLGGWNAEA